MHSNAGKEFASIASISSAPGEEEAGSEAPLIKVFAGDRPCDRGFPGAGEPIKPEDALLVLSVCPREYLLENIDARIREASRFVLLLV